MKYQRGSAKRWGILCQPTVHSPKGRVGGDQDRSTLVSLIEDLE